MYEFLNVVAKITNMLLFGALSIILLFNKNKHHEKPSPTVFISL